MAVTLLATVLVGCSGSEDPSPRASKSSAPLPESVKEADPCSFLPRSRVTAYDLKKVGKDISETSRSCLWTSAKFSMMILVRWDSQTLVDFGQAFPVLGEDDVKLDGVGVVIAKSDVRPACASVFLPEQGTVVQLVVGDKRPSTADAACERVKTIGASTIREIRDQNLLDPEPSAAASTTS
ncbi:DUF3558 family protein [Streptomyces muensis]|uniref:DUF3558 domain-containing protein n=1 Tax=Streptomyces muensis TaxID=1077944 RepID=A0A9X1TNJ9_STRM4|nr:DUF3558 family protein [Streptomyces muensis]MCF1598601.1 DUF3558 domain-containing protein [Streptomyces muensis]